MRPTVIPVERPETIDIWKVIALYQNRIVTKNEARKTIGLSPVADGDTFVSGEATRGSDDAVLSLPLC